MCLLPSYLCSQKPTPPLVRSIASKILSNTNRARLTKALFVEYHVGIKGGRAATRRQIDAEWLGMGPAKNDPRKLAWIGAFNRLTQATRAANQQDGVANTARDAANAANTANPINFLALLNALDAAQLPWERLRALRIAEQQAWVGLGNLEPQHPHPPNASLVHCGNEANRAQGLANAAQAEFSRLVQLRRQPPL